MCFVIINITYFYHLVKFIKHHYQICKLYVYKAISCVLFLFIFTIFLMHDTFFAMTTFYHFLFFSMKKTLFLLLIAVALVSLPACSLFNSRVVDEEAKKLPENAASFTGTKTEVDPVNSYISFLGTKGSAVSHEGTFATYTVTITPDETDAANLENAQIEVTIDVASMTTDSDLLTEHLSGEDFFDIANYPEATFSSTEIVSKGGDQYEIKGDMTVKDVTKSVTLKAEITDEYASIKWNMMRYEFNVGAEGDAIDNKVALDIKLALQ